MKAFTPMERLILVALTTVTVLGACGGERPGNPQVYEWIAATTDCAALQQEFDIADRNSATHYMDAAHERMSAVGCN